MSRLTINALRYRWTYRLTLNVEKLLTVYIIMGFDDEALDSDMCDVIKICLKRSDATRIGKENHPLNI